MVDEPPPPDKERRSFWQFAKSAFDRAKRTTEEMEHRSIRRRLEGENARPEDFEAARTALKQELRALRVKEADVREELRELQELERRQEYWWQFGESHFPRRRAELEQLLQDDESVGMLEFLDHVGSAVVAWELEELRRLVEAGLPGIDIAGRDQRWWRVQTGHLVDGDVATADPLLAFLADGASIDGRDALSDRVGAVIEIVRARAQLSIDPDHDPDVAPRVRALLESAARKDPQSGLPDAVWARTFRQLGRLPEAYDHATAAVETDLNRPDGFVELGIVAARLGYRAEAQDAFDRATTLLINRIRPLHEATAILREAPPELLVRLARRLAEEGARDRAYQALELIDETAAAASAVTLERRWDLEVDLRRTDRSDPTKLSIALTQAGTHRYWANEHEEAQRLLVEAADLDPAAADPRWLLADVQLRLYEEQEGAGQERDGRLLDTAMGHWEEARRLIAPAEPTDWPWLTRALLLKHKADRETQAARELTWRAIIDTSHYLTSRSDLAPSWGVLSSQLRALDLDQAALEASSIALDRDAESPFALDEAIVSLVNTAQFDEASDLMRKRRHATVGSSPWHDAVSAYVAMHTSDVPKARELFTEALRGEPGLDWAWGLLARCHVVLGEHDEAIATYERFLDHVLETGGAHDGNAHIVAVARIVLGEPDDWPDTRVMPEPPKYDHEVAAAVAAVSVADLADAERHLLQAAGAATTTDLLDDLVRFTFPLLALVAQRAGVPTGTLDVLREKLETVVAQARPAVADRDAFDELRTAQQDVVPVVQLGAHLAEAWLHAGRERWSRAEGCLAAVQDRLPTDQAALRRLWLRRAQDEAIARGDSHGARAMHARLLACGGGDEFDRIAVEARLALSSHEDETGPPSLIFRPQTPVRLELSRELVPVGWRWASGHPLFEAIGDARARMRLDLGWQLPWVTVDVPDDIDARRWRVIIGDGVAATGEVTPGRWFVPGATDHDAGRGPDRSRNGPRGDWFDERPGRGEAWDEFEYIVRAAEYEVRTQLGRLVDLQGVVDWLRALDVEPGAVTTDVSELVLLTEVVRHLLGDEVSVSDVSAVLEAFNRHRPSTDDPQLLAERVRRALLPDFRTDGATAHWLSLEFDRVLEEHVVDRGTSSPKSHVPAEIAVGVVDSLVSWLGDITDEPPNVILVTRVETARPVLAELLDGLDRRVRIAVPDEVEVGRDVLAVPWQGEAHDTSTDGLPDLALSAAPALAPWLLLARLDTDTPGTALAERLAYVGRVDDAAAALENAASGDGGSPSDLAARLMLAGCHVLRGRLDDASDEVLAIPQMHLESGVRLNLAETLVRAGRHDEARGLLEEIRAEASDLPGDEALLRRASLLYESAGSRRT